MFFGNYRLWFTKGCMLTAHSWPSTRGTKSLRKNTRIGGKRRVVTPIRPHGRHPGVEAMMRKSKRHILALGAGVVAACGTHGGNPTPDASLPFPGTYAVSICPTPCDPVRAESSAVVGHLVLEAVSYTDAEVEAVQGIYGGRGAFLYRAADGEPNACFGLRRLRRGLTYAGIRVAGLTRWRPYEQGDGFTILLYHSADSRYRATLVGRGRELHGRGESQGGRDPTERAAPADSIYARRIGPVDRNICLQAAANDTTRRRS